MATTLDLLVLPTYNKNTLGVNDASTYASAPASVSLVVTPPGFDAVTLSFTASELNVFDSEDLEISDAGETLVALPDGVYKMVYSIIPEAADAITKYVMRIEQIQEKFDAAFMKLDMMECDGAIKTQSKIDLMSIYFFIQGAVSAANNCAITESNKLYTSANNMLTYFIRNNCGCTGVNYL